MKKTSNQFFLLLIVLQILSVPNFCQVNNFQLLEIAYSSYRWTGVAVSDEGRTFVNFPRWSPVPFSVCEIVDSQLVPYPDQEWNNWNGTPSPEDHFVCVQSVYIDNENYLWILDPASLNGNVVPGGAKLLKVDLQTDSILQIIYFPESIASSQSYLNDVRVDTDFNYAYITDSGVGDIIVVDLSTGESRKLLKEHYSTKAEFNTLVINGQTVTFVVHSDGLALSNDRLYLYYKALTGNNLYRIATGVLRDTTLTSNEVENAVEFVIEAMPCDAIEFDPQGYLYFTSIQDNSIYRYLPGNDIQLVITDEQLKWPDSFSITPNGEIYVTTSRIYFPPGEHGLFKIQESSSSNDDEGIGRTENFRLYQNYPNPFNPNTKIKYSISRKSFVSLKIFDVLGNEIETLVSAEKPADTYEVNWEALNLPCGVYLCYLRAGEFVETKKMVLLK